MFPCEWLLGGFVVACLFAQKSRLYKPFARKPWLNGLPRACTSGKNSTFVVTALDPDNRFRYPSVSLFSDMCWCFWLPRGAPEKFPGPDLCALWFVTVGGFRSVRHGRRGSLFADRHACLEHNQCISHMISSQFGLVISVSHQGFPFYGQVVS